MGRVEFGDGRDTCACGSLEGTVARTRRREVCAEAWEGRHCVRVDETIPTATVKGKSLSIELMGYLRCFLCLLLLRR